MIERFVDIIKGYYCKGCSPLKDLHCYSLVRFILFWLGLEEGLQNAQHVGLSPTLS